MRLRIRNDFEPKHLRELYFIIDVMEEYDWEIVKSKKIYETGCGYYCRFRLELVEEDVVEITCLL